MGVITRLHVYRKWTALKDGRMVLHLAWRRLPVNKEPPKTMQYRFLRGDSPLRLDLFVPEYL